MGRRTDKEQIVTLLSKLRRRVPDIVIRTSLIVGFPGESESDFLELKMSLLKKLNLTGSAYLLIREKRIRLHIIFLTRLMKKKKCAAKK